MLLPLRHPSPGRVLPYWAARLNDEAPLPPRCRQEQQDSGRVEQQRHHQDEVPHGVGT
jgi:hypothetical protein